MYTTVYPSDVGSMRVHKTVATLAVDATFIAWPSSTRRVHPVRSRQRLSSFPLVTAFFHICPPSVARREHTTIINPHSPTNT